MSTDKGQGSEVQEEPLVTADAPNELHWFDEEAAPPSMADEIMLDESEEQEGEALSEWGGDDGASEAETKGKGEGRKVRKARSCDPEIPEPEPIVVVSEEESSGGEGLAGNRKDKELESNEAKVETPLIVVPKSARSWITHAPGESFARLEKTQICLEEVYGMHRFEVTCMH